jgi:hypothetical protein
MRLGASNDATGGQRQHGSMVAVWLKADPCLLNAGRRMPDRPAGHPELWGDSGSYESRGVA